MEIIDSARQDHKIIAINMSMFTFCAFVSIENTLGALVTQAFEHVSLLKRFVM